MFKYLFFFSEWHFYTWKEKKNIKQNYELFLHMLLRFEIIAYEMISVFLKHPADLK